ncbi:nitrile hydratase subunit alpha [Frigidibacter sp. ROC022]|uniref:nitrile hydratase subunit alpha n=1 Tax=Frigidibacter sp. ROC022 TaxID=2971796 RepID=UPI00215A4366|nr:nitrile hydratase subunit alpha [Frigidibacter sp. ROC022]MCR8726311.1 nitrile hydratase subunit alpha [Frigidibacter sp. ROC022]
MPHDHDHSHDGAVPHDHTGMSPSGHPYRPDQDTALSYWQVMEIAVRELAVERGLITPAEIAAQIETMDARSPANGAAVVARAWTDPAFKARLLADASEASREMGFDIGPLRLIAVENTDEVHNVIVCTLCSCYPRNLLGLPPDWYKSRAYRSRTVKEPRRVLAEFGLTLPESTTVRVHDSTADMRYIVLPARPEGTEGMTAEALAELVTRDSMIGTGLPRSPGA